MNLRLPDDPGVRNYFADEQPIRDKFWHPRAGEVVIDVGSALGSYSMPALAAGARVIAVEPDEHARAMFATIAGMNGLTGYAQLAAMLFDGGDYPPAMRHELENSAYYYLIPPPWTPLHTLDYVVEDQELGRLDWVKIDVEGAELGVIEGGLAALEVFHPKLLIEDHTGIYPFVAEIHSREKICSLLSELGYQVEITSYGPPDRAYLYAELTGGRS